MHPVTIIVVLVCLALVVASVSTMLVSLWRNDQNRREIAARDSAIALEQARREAVEAETRALELKIAAPATGGSPKSSKEANREA